jgi:hypothetical protein
MKKLKLRFFLSRLTAFFLITALLCVGVPRVLSQSQSVQQYSTQTTTVSPNSSTAVNTEAAQLSPSQREALLQKLKKRREAKAARVNNNPPRTGGQEVAPSGGDKGAKVVAR